jgi:hypothetical protein
MPNLLQLDDVTPPLHISNSRIQNLRNELRTISVSKRIWTGIFMKRIVTADMRHTVPLPPPAAHSVRTNAAAATANESNANERQNQSESESQSDVQSE